MSRVFRRRLAGFLAAVTALALSGGDAVILATSRGSSTTPALTAIVQPRHVLAPPSLASPGDPAPASPVAAPTPPPEAAEKPPPVVDGVRRTNVGSAHSPQTQNQLSSLAATMPPPADAGALGVDVADYQHPHGVAINWPRVAAAGYKFAFIKATEGDYYTNPYYAVDMAQAKAAGLYAAGYHFAVPNVSGGASQADYAVRNGGFVADGRTLPLALDIEYNPYGGECYGLSAAGMVSWLSAFTAEVQRLTGQRPVIYTTADWWQTCTGGSTAFGSDPLWVAGYGTGSPPIPAGWANWTFWQYTSQGRVPGISGSTDVSYFLGGAVRLLDPGNQQDSPGSAIHMQVESLNAAAGQPPHFSASGLPPGLSINGGGLITGTITSTASGTYTVTVTAAYPSGSSGSVSFTWTVVSSQPTSPPSPSPSPSSSPSPSPSSSPVPSTSVSPSPGPSASALPSPSVSASSAPAPSPSPSAGSASAGTTPGLA